MRRLAFLTCLDGMTAQSEIGALYTAIGSMGYEGRLVDAVRDAPSGNGMICVCLETGHAFSRLGRDCDHLGTLFGLMHLHAVAQAFVHDASLPLVFIGHDRDSAIAALVTGAGLAPEQAREAIDDRAPVTMTRSACLKALVKGLPSFDAPARQAFRTVEVHHVKVLG
jgi:hypothetical protein